MDFQLSGLASGFDWLSMVDSLMQIERIPQQRLRSEQTANNDKLNAFGLLGTKLDSLNASVGDLSDTSLFNAKSISLSDETLGITASAGTSAVVGNYSFKVSQLATTTKRTGTADVGGAMGDTSTVLSNLRLKDDLTEGTFSINGQEVTIATTDTLQDVFDAISTATSGEVTASYDGVGDLITLTSSTGQLELGATGDTSNFLSAMKLDQLEVQDAGGGATSVTSASKLGVVDLASSIAASGIGGGSPITGTGTIIINGVSIDFDADTESIGSLMGKINSSAADVTMTYDSAADQFRIVNNQTGAYEMHVVDSGSGIMNALGLDGAAEIGNDLTYTVDGGVAQTSRSNSITSADHGIDGLTVTATAVGTQSISIGRDATDLRGKVEAFISAYNDVQDFILEKTKIEVEDDEVTAEIFAGNREISSLDSKLRALAFDQVPDISGDIFRLEHLGIDFISGTSKLEIKDASKLDAALEGNLDELEDFFTSATTGFSNRMEEFLDNYTDTDGLLDFQEDTLTARNTAIDEQIAEMERMLEFKRSALEAGFIAMEEAQAKIQQQQSALSSILGV